MAPGLKVHQFNYGKKDPKKVDPDQKRREEAERDALYYREHDDSLDYPLSGGTRKRPVRYDEWVTRCLTRQ